MAANPKGPQRINYNRQITLPGPCANTEVSVVVEEREVVSGWQYADPPSQGISSTDAERAFWYREVAAILYSATRRK